MQSKIYQLLLRLDQRGYPLFLLIYARSVAILYFLMFPKRSANSVRFYRCLYPQRTSWQHILMAMRQYVSFTHLFVERGFQNMPDKIEFRSTGWEHIENALKNERGGIILMSHIGNWEMAMHLMKNKKKDLPLLMYMGSQTKENIEKQQKEALTRKGVQIIVVDEGQTSPMVVIEGINHLKKGGLIAMTGDRLWSKNQRMLKTEFLGHEISLPEIPYALSMIGNSPLIPFYAFRINRNRYDIRAYPPITPIKSDRIDRARSIRQAADLYVKTLTEAVALYPEQWFHFEPFL